MSVAFSAADVAKWTGATQLLGAAEDSFEAVSIDTRTLPEGALFVAIRGPNHDAHRFLADAIAGGASGLFVERAHALALDRLAGVSVLAVEDTTQALGELAAGHRAGFDGPLVAVTGSSGKTTTKEMCAAILSERAPCLKTEGNLNNHYGMPLTLLRRDAIHRSAVIEIGMNHRGEIAPLARIARPSVALVTNVGTAHIEFLGSQVEIAHEKGDLFAALDRNGVAIVNLDDPLVAEEARRAPGRSLTYARYADADVRPENVRFLTGGVFSFDLRSPEGRTPVRVAGLSDTAVINALAASAAALAADASLSDVSAGLARYRPIAGRMAPVPLADEITLIDDTYNANPQSMRAALQALAELKGRDRAVAVLGGMGELGETAAEEHRGTGRFAAELEIDHLFAVGEHASLMADGAIAAGLGRERVRVCSDPADAAHAVREILQPRDWVLVKGSRAAHMERIVASLRDEGVGNGNGGEAG